MPTFLMRGASCVLAAACSFPVASGAAHAAPTAATAVPFARAPANLRAYLAAARIASAIADPLQRCLAMPDLPANRWPAGLARAHCHLSYAPSISLARVAAMLDSNAYAALDALFQADLDQHFDALDPSEIIHLDFEIFNGSDESDRVSKLWLEGAPASPFAMAARGIHFEAMAWKARGAKVASDTSELQRERMQGHARQAIFFLSRAAARQPRLISAHAVMLGIGMMVGDEELEAEALRRGSALDPACRNLTVSAMTALTPRWDGSHEAMEAYAATLTPYLARRPLLANTLAMIAVDRADSQFERNQYREKIAFLEPVAQISSHSGVYGTLSMSMAYAGWPDSWSEIKYLLQLVRFNHKHALGKRELGRLLLQENEPEWAAEWLEQAARHGTQ